MSKLSLNDQLLPFVSGNKILDIDCEYGDFVDTLTKKGFDATGVSQSSKPISFARQNYQGKFLVVDPNLLPFENQFFDTVFVHHLLEYSDNDLKILKEVLRVGKKIILITPHHTSKKLEKLGLIFQRYQTKTPFRAYDSSSLQELIFKAKGQLVSLSHTNKLSTELLIFQLLPGIPFFKKIFIKLILFLFHPISYYLELIAIIKP